MAPVQGWHAKSDEVFHWNTCVMLCGVCVWSICVAASLEQKKRNVTWQEMRLEEWWNTRETHEIVVYEHFVNHMLNKYKNFSILSSLHVMKAFLHIYFGDYDPQFSISNMHSA